MDWARAKTILIIVFLIANICLTYQLVVNTRGAVDHVSQEDIDEIVGYLGKNHIEVSCKVPQNLVNLPPITVKYRLFNSGELTGLFFRGKEAPTVTVNEGSTSMTGGNISLQIINGRELYYMNSSIKPHTELNQKECRKTALEFLKKLGINDKYQYIKSSSAEGGFVKLTLGQRFKGIIIENSSIEITANEAGVATARVIWFDSVKPLSSKKDVAPPVAALLKIARTYKDSGEQINIYSIEQKYFFNIGDTKQFDITKLVEGTAFPVWKLQSSKGTIYVNGFNEKIEKVDEAYE